MGFKQIKVLFNACRCKWFTSTKNKLLQLKKKKYNTKLEYFGLTVFSHKMKK